MPPDEPTPADFTSDLAAIEHRQALLHAALAAFQAPSGPTPLGEHGLALYHRLAVLNGQHSIEAVLVHAAGGEISSGFLPVDPSDHTGIREAQQLTTSILVAAIHAPDAPKPQQSQKARPIAVCPAPAPVALPLQQEPPPAAEPDPEPTPAPAPAADEPPTKEEISALIDDLDRVFNRRPTRVKELTTGFREQFEIGPKTPVAKAITSRDRLIWLRAAVDQLLEEIAAFDQGDQPSQEAA
jgi:hypothetical protein